MKTRILAVTLAAVLAGGCSVGPDTQDPAPRTAEAYDAGVGDGYALDPATVKWWDGFGDSVLNDLVDRAITGSRTVQAATAFLRQARALYAADSFDLLPKVTVEADYTRQLFSNATFLGGVPRSDREFGYYNAAFDASWELDLWGRVRRSVEAAKDEVGAAEASRRDALLTLIAEVARNYFELKGARIRLEVARQSAQVQQETLQFTVSRFEAGRGTELDVARARAELNSTLAILPPIEVDAARAKNRIAVLLGNQPEGFTLIPAGQDSPGTLPALVAIGKPEDLLRRRPDIRQAERHLAAATARIGVATADLFPKVTFNGSFGPQAPGIPGLLHAGAAAYSYGPSITWAALDLGRVAARIRAANAEAEGDFNLYQQTVLLALEETENALVQFGRERARERALVEAVKASERAATLADARYQAGAADFLTSLDAQRTVLSLRIQLAESRTRTVTSLIALYKALGGGWEIGSAGTDSE